ncbi:MAG TPA: ABC transporter permease [Gemmatimonadales bacterium]|nr:ABC transporter permease [Gemmatimonadales bacterium]
MDSILQDLRYAARTLAKAPGFTATAILTLALGIGATTGVFSVIDAALLRPLPFRAPERLAVLEHTWGPPPAGFPKMSLDLTDWRAHPEIFDQVGSYSTGGMNLAAGSGAERVKTALVTTTFFDLLGARPALGRAFGTDEGEPGRGGVVILSDGLWRTRFGGDHGVLGRTVTLNERPFVVIGVMPRGFGYPRQSEVWIPRSIPEDMKNWDMFHSSVVETVIGRVRGGLTFRDAQVRADGVSRAFRQDHPLPPGATDARMTLTPFRDVLVGDSRPGLLVLFGATGLILLIACSNAAGLLLARAARRQHEVAVRAVLGATRTRVVRQMLTESGLLALAGAGAGLLLAWWLQGSLAALVPARLADVAPVTMDLRVLVFAAAGATLATVLFGLAPAVGLARTDLQSSLRAGGYRSWGVRARRLRGGIVAAEVGLALTLLVGAGLMLKSLYLLTHVDPGFDREGVLTATVSLPSARYRAPGGFTAVYRRLLGRFQALPGVTAVGTVNAPPLLREGAIGLAFDIVGRPPFPMDADRPFAEQLVVSPGYFAALRIPVIRGRVFTAADDSGAPPVAIINASMARRYWPQGDAIGARIMSLGGRGGPLTVVGVVSDVEDGDLGDSTWQSQIYTPYEQNTPAYLTFAIRAALPPAELAASVRRAAAEADPTVPLYDIRTMEQVVETSIAPERSRSLLIGVSGLLAVLLAGVGVYGVMAQVVSQRTREIGVRMALGASGRSVLGLVVRSGLWLTGVGVVAGLAAAWALSRVLGSLLYQVSVTDASVFVGAPAVLCLVALAACYFPARRASRVDPVVALRTE